MTIEDWTEIIKCAACSQVPHDPKCLWCPHSLCTSCLRSHVTDQDMATIITCPVCQEITVFSSCVIGLEKNHTSDALRRLLVSILGPRDDTYDPTTSPGSTQCYRHPSKPVCFFCDDCKRPICEDCRLKRETCFRHEYLPLQDNNKTLYESLSDLRTELDNFQQELRDHSQSELVDRIDLEGEILRRTVDDFIDSHIRAVEARRQAIRANLRTTSQSLKGCIRRHFAEFSSTEHSWTNLVTSLSQLFIPSEMRFVNRFHEISIAIEDVRESIKNRTFLGKIAFKEQPNLKKQIESLGSLKLPKEHLGKRGNVSRKSVRGSSCEALKKFPENPKNSNGLEVRRMKCNGISNKVKVDLNHSQITDAKELGEDGEPFRETATKNTGRAKRSDFLENRGYTKKENLDRRDNGNRTNANLPERSDFGEIQRNVKLEDLEKFNDREKAANGFPQVLTNKTNQNVSTNVKQNLSRRKDKCRYNHDIKIIGEKHACGKCDRTDLLDLSVHTDEGCLSEDGILRNGFLRRFIEGSSDIAKNSKFSEVWPPTKCEKSDPSNDGTETSSDEISSRLSWKLNSDNCIGSLQVSTDGLGAHATVYGWNAVVGDSGFMNGKHSWKVRVRDWSVLGVCYLDDHIACPQWWTGDKWVCIVSSYSHGELDTPTSEDEILMTLDCEKKTLTLVDLKTKRQEVVSGFKEAVYPYFSLSCNSSIRIFEINEKSA